jgi:hypothetical protein
MPQQTEINKILQCRLINQYIQVPFIHINHTVKINYRYVYQGLDLFPVSQQYEQSVQAACQY